MRICGVGGAVDEVSFGSEREFRWPARYRRALAAVAAAGVATAVVVTLTTHHATGAGQAASPTPSTWSSPAPTACPPTLTTQPKLAGLPAGLHPGALHVVADSQFSGECRG
jgi:hypothetical protein